MIDNSIFLIGAVRDKANQFLIREMEKRQIHGLVPSHGAIFFALFKEPALTMTDLATRIGRDKSTVTALVDKLAGAGYLRKEKDREDNRITCVALTDKGHELQEALREISDELMTTAYRGITAAERTILLDILARMKDNF